MTEKKVKKKSKKKESIPEKPIAIVNNDIDKDKILDFLQDVNRNKQEIKNKNESDNFYKNVLDTLYNVNENVETKTEYKGVEENFMGAKMEFLGRFTRFPFMRQFINIFERKRISLDRKGREEIILALQERQQEEREERRRDLLNNLRNNRFFN